MKKLVAILFLLAFGLTSVGAPVAMYGCLPITKATTAQKANCHGTSAEKTCSHIKAKDCSAATEALPPSAFEKLLEKAVADLPEFPPMAPAPITEEAPALYQPHAPPYGAKLRLHLYYRVLLI